MTMTLLNNGNVRMILCYCGLGGLSLLWFALMLIKNKKSNNAPPPLPPGPKPLPLVGNLFSLDSQLHTYLRDLSKIYGPILTLWFGKKVGIIISSPAVAREVLKDQGITFANRDVPAAAKAGAYGGIDIAWAPYGEEWRMLRKVCVRDMLSNTTLDSVYGLRRKELRQTIKFLYNQAGKQVNVGEHMFLTLFNVITSMLWGGTIKGEEMASVGAEFRQAVSEMTGVLGLPNISDFYPGLARFDLQGIQKKSKRSAEKLDRLFQRMIDQRLKMMTGTTTTTIGEKGPLIGYDGKEIKDFLQLLLQLKDAGDAKVPLTINHLKAVLMDMLVGGTDTTSNAAEFAMAEIMNNPQVMKKVQQELEEVVGKNRIVEESDIQKLPYLYAVMREALRLHPTLPVLLPHSPSQTCSVSGFTVPKGARVLINVWAIHRDPSVWENPLEFRPERFLDSEVDYSGNDFTFFPFGSGRRICAGMAMAERMFMFSLASLLHSFEWKLPQGEKLDMEEKFGIVLTKKIPLIAIPTPRLADASLYG